MNNNKPWQQWVQAELQKRQQNPGDLHRLLIQRGMDVSESYIYRVAQGRMRSKIGYELALAIGAIFGKEVAAIHAAGYRLPEEMLEQCAITDVDGRRFVLNPAGVELPAATADFLVSVKVLQPGEA